VLLVHGKEEPVLAVPVRIASAGVSRIESLGEIMTRIMGRGGRGGRGKPEEMQ
jgi:hypothetical protein